MKKGYKRLLIFQIFSIIAFIMLNSFVSSILGQYFKVIFLIIMLIIFKLFFGFEKDRHRYIKSICIEILIYLLIYFIVYYLLGILMSFTRTIDYWHFKGIFLIIIPTILVIILKELFRYFMLVKSEGNKLSMITTCLFFIIFDLVSVYNISAFNSPYTLFVFMAINLLPIISRNVFSSYLAFKCGYKPVLLYALIINLYIYLVPIIPNPNQYLYSVIELIVPMIFLYQIYKFFKKDLDEEVVRVKYKKRALGLIIPSSLVIVLVYFTSGYFYYHAIAVASGSMESTIMKGDVVVIEKVKNKKNINPGQIIAYRYEKIIIVHRIIKKIDVDNEVFYYTKGDANNDMDNYKITEDMIVGIVNVKIPYIGLPTVWINGM